MKKKTWIWLIIILVLAGCLRFYQINNESLWYDEGYTLETISKDKGMWDMLRQRDNTPPLYYFSLKYWSSKFGFTEFGMRSFSTIFGILSVLLIFLIGKNLFNEERGLFISILMAVELSQIMISQEARVYSFFIFTVLLASYFFVKAKDNNWYWMGYFISAFIMLNTHFFSIFIMAIHIIFFLWYSFKIKIITFIEILAGLFILTAPFYVAYTPIINNIINFFSEQYPLFGINALYIVMPIAGIILLIIFLLGKDFFENIVTNLTLFAFFLAGIILTYPLLLGYLVATPAFYIRYTIWIYPLLYIYLGMNIWRFKGGKYLLTVFIAVLLSASFLFYYSIDNKEQWKDAVRYIDDGVVLVIDGDAKPIFEYYYKGDNKVVFIRSEPMPEGYVLKGIQDYDYLYLVLSHNYWDEGYWKSAFNKFPIIKQYRFKGVEVIKYDII